jgi:DNA modification methylase
MIYNQHTIKLGDYVELMKELDIGSINQIFAAPQYNLSGENFQTVKSGKMVKGMHKSAC